MPPGRAFTAHVLAYYATRDLVPLYSVYALLFADAGVSASRISLLFVIWSLTSFVVEVPSGAWADLLDRRLLLVVSALVYAAAFASWLLLPTFSGFALGFVLWGVSGSIMSGTFESLLYDELDARGAADAYPRLVGWAESAAMVATLVAAGLAVPLLSVGGYPLVGWASVGLVGVHLALAATLPVSVAARRPNRVGDLVLETERLTEQYVAMLRSGLREATTSVDVRRVVLLAAVLVGLTAYDEYFPLIAREHGVALSTVPVLVAVTVLGQALGTVLAGRTAGLAPRTIGAMVLAGAVLVSVGALVTPYAGFVAIGVGYGLLNNTMIVAEARLQQVITGPARATVTSVHGVATEVVALGVYAAFAVGAGWLPTSTLVAALGLPIVVVAWAVARWFPEPPGGLEDSAIRAPAS